MKPKLFLFFVSILLLSVFAVFSKYVKAGHLKSIDFDTTVRIQDRIPARLDEFMADGAIFADPFVSSALVLTVTVYAFLKIRGRRKLLVFAIPIAFAVLTILEIYGKNFVPHPGPPFFMVKHPTTVFPEFTIIQPYSYPSGHMARITFLAVILFSLIIKQFNNITIFKKRLWIGIGLVIYVAFIAVSRIYLGHHWLSDILGGLFLGSAMALFPFVLL